MRRFLTVYLWLLGCFASPLYALEPEISSHPDEPYAPSTLEVIRYEAPVDTDFAVPALAEEEYAEDENTGVSGSVIPHIPEPMVFDLIRPLGSRKGELEVNTLSLMSLHKGNTVEWAPEIEYAFLDNHALELELPFANLELEDLKAAYQYTLGTALDNRFIHGIQTIGKYNLHHKAPSVDGLYIAGYQLNDNWSMLTMAGIRHKNLRGGSRGKMSGLLNPSIFYAPSSRVRLGLESNMELGRANYYLLMPQIHLEMGKHHSLQAGAGVEMYRSNRFRPVIGIRLIREL